MFLRAERMADGRRTFPVTEGEPLPTRSSQRIARPIPPVGQVSSSISCAIQKWRRQNPPAFRKSPLTIGDIMLSYRNEWIPFRSPARTALQIAHPPSANALRKTVRVNKRGRGEPPLASFAVFAFIFCNCLTSTGQAPPRQCALFIEHDSSSVSGIFAEAITPRQKPLVRSHQLCPA